MSNQSLAVLAQAIRRLSSSSQRAASLQLGGVHIALVKVFSRKWQLRRIPGGLAVFVPQCAQVGPGQVLHILTTLFKGE